MGNGHTTLKSRLQDLRSGDFKFENQELVPYLLRKYPCTTSFEPISNVYRIGPLLGQGSYGKVKSATLIDYPGHKFAIKSIKKSRLAKEYIQKDIELAMFTILDHPNIVKIYEVYEDSDKIHFVMELCEGGNLQEKLESMTDLDENYVRRIMFSAFSTVKYLHNIGIVHRDIKPENFLFTGIKAESDIKLADFGLAKYFGATPSTPLSTQVGTVCYTAPEVFDGQYNEKCDLWSMGVILYMFLSNSYPFPYESYKGLVNKIKKGKFTMKGKKWDCVSEEAKDLVRKLLVVNPALRLSASEALEHPFLTGTRNVERPIINFSKLLRGGKEDDLSKMLKRVSMRFLSRTEHEKLKRMFRYFDKESNGYIRKSAFIEEINKLNPDLEEDKIQIFLQNFEVQAVNELIFYTDFVLGISTPYSILTESRAIKVYEYFDTEGFGDIRPKDVQTVFRRNAKDITDEEAKTLVSYADFDRDGNINYNDFKRFVEDQN